MIRVSMGALVAAWLLAGCAAAPSQPAPAATPASPAAAAPAQALPANQQAAADKGKDKPLCRKEMVVGSRFPKMVCHDPSAAGDSQNAVRGIQQGGLSGAPGYMGN